MPSAKIAEQRSSAKLNYRALVQASARGEEVDPDSVEKILILAARSFDDLDADATALETALAEEAAHEAVDYAGKIAAATKIRDKARAMRPALQAEEDAINKRWEELQALEGQGQQVDHWLPAQRAARNEMLRSRNRLLGTNNIDDFPAVD